MTRLIWTSCGVFAEFAALNAAQTPLLWGLAIFSLVASLVAWWTYFHQWIDRIIGLDLPHANLAQLDEEID